jgi:ribosome-associated heat shock protein Hsp15
VDTALLFLSKGRRVYQHDTSPKLAYLAESMALRIDKWLFYTRFFKTRGLAAKAVTGGHVRLNGVRAKRSSGVQPGDVIELVRDQLRWKVTARELPARRGPASEARQCYEEDEEVRAGREAFIDGRKMDRLQMPQTDGRPDKHTRRLLRSRRRPD